MAELVTKKVTKKVTKRVKQRAVGSPILIYQWFEDLFQGCTDRAFYN
jgi:hypothetical protein